MASEKISTKEKNVCEQSALMQARLHLRSDAEKKKEVVLTNYRFICFFSISFSKSIIFIVAHF